METYQEVSHSGTTIQPGVIYELPFTEMDRHRGKVGLNVRLTEFFKAAKKRNRQQNPIAPNQADVVKWILWDRFQFAAGTTIPSKFQFFTMPIGTNAKTKIDTNLDQVQRLPDPLWYNTEGLAIYFSPQNTESDINQFLLTEYLEFWVGQKVYSEGPCQCYPSGAGLLGNNQVATLITNGVPRADNVYDLRLPAGIHLGNDPNNTPIITDGLIGVTILQGQQFHVDMNAPAGGAALSPTTATPPGTGLSIMCFLFGILSRGVQ